MAPWVPAAILGLAVLSACALSEVIYRRLRRRLHGRYFPARLVVFGMASSADPLRSMLVEVDERDRPLIIAARRTFYLGVIGLLALLLVALNAGSGR